MKLQGKILTPIIVLLVVMMGVNSYLSYKEAAGNLLTVLRDNMKGEAEGAVRATSELVRNSYLNVQRTADMPQVRELLTADPGNQAARNAVSKTLTELLPSYPDFSTMNVLTPDGLVVASTDPTLAGKVNIGDRAYVQKALKGESALSSPFFGEHTKSTRMVISIPVHDGGGKIVGVMTGAISFDNYFKNSIDPIRIGEKGFAYVVDAEGQVVAARNKNWLFNKNLPATSLYLELAKEKTGAMRETIGNDGRRVALYYLKEPLANMTIIVRAETDDVFSGLNAIFKTSVTMGVLSSLLGALIVFAIVRPVVRAVNKSAAFAVQVAAGNLEGSLGIKRSDEVGDLAVALEAIPRTLKDIVNDYGALEKDIEEGRLDSQGNATKFSGAFASLIRGTNSILARFTLLVDNIPSPIVLLDASGHVRFLNAFGRELAGGEYKGRVCGELFNREDYGTPADAQKKALKSDSSATSETKIHPGGKSMDISYSVVPLKNAEGKIACLLQTMTDLTAIKNAQRAIAVVADQAHGISNRVATAAEQLSRQVEQASEGTSVQHNRVLSTATAMEEMNATVMEVAKNASDASVQAESTRQKATQGEGLVNDVIGAIRQVNVVSHELEETMKELGTQADAIGNVMNVISDIADQTNLLALNAAIEAARAGDAGRGFAVVADEVRKLAEKTMGATSEVGTTIRRIQDSAAHNVSRVVEAVSSADKATELAGTSGKALEEILRLANVNSSLITGIATAAEEQSATSAEINASIDEINKIANETSLGMEEAFSAVRELSSMAQELRVALDKLQTETH